MSDLAERRKALLKRWGELDTRLRGIEEELDEHQSTDWEDLAIEREGDEVLERIGSASLAEIDRIKAALRRIEEGSYGLCVRCGNDISEKRLDVLPATPFCRDCAP